jgi:hypothetical protein
MVEVQLSTIKRGRGTARGLRRLPWLGLGGEAPTCCSTTRLCGSPRIAPSAMSRVAPAARAFSDLSPRRPPDMPAPPMRVIAGGNKRGPDGGSRRHLCGTHRRFSRISTSVHFPFLSLATHTSVVPVSKLCPAGTPPRRQRLKARQGLQPRQRSCAWSAPPP